MGDSETIAFNGISFQLQGNWNVTTEEVLHNSLYYIGCEKNDDTADLFVVRFSKEEISPVIFLKDYLHKLNSKTTLLYDKIENGKFGKYECIFANYSFLMTISTYHGTVYAFEAEDKVVLVVKQTDSKRRLNKVFALPESSFQVD
jgi:hypothetical protein